MIKYCVKCVMPDTKPDLHFDSDGICSACRSYASRKEVDWTARKKELLTVVEYHKNKSGKSNWDCIVPVSGGKDSTYQVLKVLELGMKPLCVISTTCFLSEIGRKNIENLKSLGVDVMEFSPNPKVRALLNKIGLESVGDISWPEHVGIFTIPVRIAAKFGISLLVWGENSQHEYGGPASATERNYLDRRWLEEFGGLLGLRVSDISELDQKITDKDLLPYVYPTDEELSSAQVTGLFLGYYLPWDGYSNTLISQAHGFSSHRTVVEGSAVNYENLDNLFHGIHDYFKYLKFGFARATDQTALHVRRGRMTRAEAMDIVRNRDGKYPWSYLDIPLEVILKKIDMSLEEFDKICDQFTNQKLFKKSFDGRLLREKDNSLIKVNYDNEC